MPACEVRDGLSIESRMQPCVLTAVFVVVAQTLPSCPLPTLNRSSSMMTRPCKSAYREHRSHKSIEPKPMLQTPSQAHSAIITIRLEIEGRDIELSHSGPDYVLLCTPTELPACDADLVLTFNGNELRSQVSLPDGASLQSRRCRYEMRAI